MLVETNHITVQKTARYFTSGKPEQAKIFFFAMHGYGQQAERLIRKFDHLGESIFVLAPEGLSRFYWNEKTGQTGASWMTKDDRELEIADYCNYLQQLYERYLPQIPQNCKIILLGFSQGGATAMRWLLLNKPEKINEIQLWGSDIPPDLDYKNSMGYLKDKKLYWIYGNKDPYLGDDRLAQLKKRFETFQLNPEIIVFEGEHELDRNTLTQFVDGLI